MSPTGNPSEVPHGTLTAGWPVTLNAAVFPIISRARSMRSQRSVSGPGNSGAFIGVVGMRCGRHPRALLTVKVTDADDFVRHQIP
jgi:hypothetical protein